MTESLLAKKARNTPFLSREEEQSLGRRAASGDREASEQLILSHLQVVFRVARRYGRFGVPINDLVQEGLIGLMTAVRKFNPDRHVRLSTYAMWWIRAAIQEHIFRTWSVVRVGKTANHRDLFFNLKSGGSTLWPPGNADAKDVLGALSKRFRLPFTEVQTLVDRLSGHDQSLDTPAPETDTRAPVRCSSTKADTFADRLADTRPTPEDIAERNGVLQAWASMIAAALASLPAREALIIRDRYLTDAARTFEAIGKDLGLSKDRVRQLERQALQRLSEILAPAHALHGLPVYLPV